MLSNQEFEKMADNGIRKVFPAPVHYKYIGFTDGLEHVLTNNTLKFSDPTDFNDPFDCNEQMLDIVIEPAVERQVILEACQKKGLPRAEIRKQLNRVGNKVHYRDAIREKKKSFKVSCFSEVCDDVLMWSHYAEKHRGLCIGFELQPVTIDYALYPVNYISECLEIDGMSRMDYLFYFLVTFKAARWAYEREIRAVSTNGLQVQSFAKEAIKEIFFGCNVSNAKIAETIKTLKKLRYHGVLYFQMVLNPKNMELKKVSLRY